MRVIGDNAPIGAYSVEKIPKTPGMVLVRFFSDPQPFERQEEGVSVAGYEYNEYHMELTDNGSVADMVEANYDALLSRAIAAEGGSVKAQIAALKAQLAETDYKIVKCSEYQLAGLEVPYDIAALHAERQALRDQINALEVDP